MRLRALAAAQRTSESSAPRKPTSAWKVALLRSPPLQSANAAPHRRLSSLSFSLARRALLTQGSRLSTMAQTSAAALCTGFLLSPNRGSKPETLRRPTARPAFAISPAAAISARSTRAGRVVASFNCRHPALWYLLLSEGARYRGQSSAASRTRHSPRPPARSNWRDRV